MDGRTNADYRYAIGGLMETSDWQHGAAPATYEEFLHEVNDLHFVMGGHWRLGQCYFNQLKARRPDLAEQLRASLYDPYFKEEIHKDTHDWVERKW